MKIVHLILFLFSFSIVFSQTSISGKISDKNGMPVFGVNVFTDRTEGTVTDFDGKYFLEVKEGVFEIDFSSIGYLTQKQTVEIAKDESKIINLVFFEEEIKIEQTIVYGNKRGKLLQEEVQSVEILKAEMLENNNVTDALQAVELISGVTVLDGQMSIRGGSGYAYGVGSRVIAVQNEVPVMSPERGEINWDFIATENVEQMELLKGGGGVQYGSSALNGVLNIRSAWAKKKEETTVSLYNTFIGNPRIKKSNWWKKETTYKSMPHRLGFTFVHKRKLKNNVDITFSGMLHSFQSHLKEEFNDRIRFNFNIRHRSDKYEGLTLGLYSMSMYRNDSFFFIWEGNKEKQYLPSAVFAKEYSYNMLHPFVSFYDKKGNSFKYNGSIYYDARITNKNIKSINVYNDFQYRKKFHSTLSSILGFTMENLLVKAPALRDVYFPDDEYGWFSGSKYGLYLLGDYKIKKLSISAGARYEVISLENKLLSSKPVFNLGFNYKASNKNYFRLNFAQAFRLPSIAERYVDESLGDINIYPNPEIRPETGYTSEIGYKRMLKNKKWKGFADISIFLTEFDDMIEFHFGDYSNEQDTVLKFGFRAENVSRARIFGWEFNVEQTGKIGLVYVSTRIGYTYAYGVDLNANTYAKNILHTVGNAFKGIYVNDEKHKNFEAAPGLFRPKNPLFGILKYRNRHTLKWNLDATFKRFSLGTNLAYYSYIDNIDNVFRAMIPGVRESREEQNYNGELIVNVRGAYKIKDKVDFTFSVNNVFNNDYSLRLGKQNAPINYTLKSKFYF